MKQIANELDDERMQLVKRIINIEDHLGIETGPFDNEQQSLSGNHNDLAEGKFSLKTFTNGNNSAQEVKVMPNYQPWEYIDDITETILKLMFTN